MREKTRDILITIILLLVYSFVIWKLLALLYLTSAISPSILYADE
jgi:hypothetical protein